MPHRFPIFFCFCGLLFAAASLPTFQNKHFVSVAAPMITPIAGGLTVAQGTSPILQVATVNDAMLPANRLRVEAVPAPGVGIAPLTPTTDGKVSAQIFAACTLAPGTYRAILRVTNEANQSATAEISVQVVAARAPTFNNAPTRLNLREGFSYLLAVLPPNTTPLSGTDFVLQYTYPDSFQRPDGNEVQVYLNGYQIAPLRGLIGAAGGAYYRVSVGSVNAKLSITVRTPCSTIIGGHQLTLVSQGASTACTYPLFATAQSYDRAAKFSLVATGDFNGDGRSDVAAINATTNQLKTWLAQANGVLQPTGSVPVRRAAVSLIAADFTRDGKLDLALSNYDAQNPPAANERGVTILTGAGNGTFVLNRNYEVGHGYLAAGDLNRDGHPDLAVTEWLNAGQERRLRILLNNGQGQFSEGPAPALLNANAVGLRLTLAHINSDADLDILTTGVPSPGRALYQFNGNGQGGFQGVICQLPGQESLGAFVYAADFNGDNRLDPVVYFDQGDGQFNLSNYRLRLFSGETTLFTAFAPTFINLMAADFNRDSKTDLLTSSGQMLTTGTPSPFCAIAGTSFNPAAAGDFNNDGRPDVVATGDNGLHVYLNQSNVIGNVATVSAASFNSVVPSPFADVPTIASDQIVAAFGSNLATGTAVARSATLPTTLAGTQVRLREYNGTEHLAPLFFVSPNQVNFLVPPNLTFSNQVPGYTEVIVTNGNNLVSQGLVAISSTAPGLFAANANGQGVAAATILRVLVNGAQRYEPVAQFDAASNRFVAVPVDLSNTDESVFLILYGTGIRGRWDLNSVNTTIGDVRCETLYASAQGSLAGLDQVNVRLPRSLVGRGEVDVIVSVHGFNENVVRVNIK